MTKKQRVLAAITGGEVDRVPAGFSLHFPKERAHGDAAVQAHLDFFRETDCDISKIMNENLVPLAGELGTPDDWDKVPAFDRATPFMQHQLQLVGDIMAKVPEGSYVVATLHGICASAIHPFESLYDYVPIREKLCAHLRENSAPVLRAFERITDGMIDYARACLEMGVDGIYYAALGGEKHFFTDDEFRTFIAPFEKKILSAIRDAGGHTFLHICKENLNMQRYESYGALSDVVNWGVYETGFSLEEGRKLFPKSAIMGGLHNRSGVLVDGTKEELTQAVGDIIASFGKKGFLLGADCTLPTEIPTDSIAAAVKTAADTI